MNKTVDLVLPTKVRPERGRRVGGSPNGSRALQCAVAPDQRSTIIDSYLQMLARLAADLPRGAIQRAVDVLFDCWQRGGCVFLIGNGGSASTATHVACDLAKATIVAGRRRLRAMALVDNVALVSAWTNDSGFASVFAEQLEPWMGEGDVLIALSVHGGSGQGEAGPWSQNLARAATLARERGARVIAVAGFGGGVLASIADVAIVIPVDSEPLGTPLVESFQVATGHLLCLALRQCIAESEDGFDRLTMK